VRSAAVTIAALLLIAPDVAAQVRGRLQVASNRRYLQYEDGRPFFYMADTAWMLFHRLNREESARYLEDRARKGFSVIQAVALPELDGLTTPNPYGAPIIKPPRVRESWFDPRYGALYEIHTTDNLAFQTYTPPTSGRGQDWVLVLEGVK
jgi:hypothetical protein